jgi:hypothetical protein
LRKPFRRRDDGVDGLVASFLAATAIASTRSSGRKVRPTVFDSPMASAAFVAFASAHVAHRLNVPWEMDTRSKAGHCVCSAPHGYTELQRAEERTRTADPISLRVIGQALQGFAGDCKCCIFRGVSFLRLAECCTVLRSRWYQSGINRGIAPAQYCSLAHASEVRPAPRRHTSIQLTLDHYSHWMPSMGRDTADGMDEALG